MALSANVKKVFNEAFTNPASAAAVAAAIDANTLKTGVTAAGAITTTTTAATTTVLHTMVKSLVASLQAGGFMS